MTRSKWPVSGAKYEDDVVGEDAQARWQHAFEDALRTGMLKLEPTSSTRIRTLRGACPRCGHVLKGIDIYGSMITGVTTADNRAAITNVVCNCEKAHAGRPEGKTGCGWAPNLTVTFIWRNSRASG